MHSPMLAVESLAAIARGRGQSVYRCPPVVPPGYEPVPLAFHGADALPVVGIATRLWRTITDPIGLVREADEHSGGNPFTIRIPGRFDLTYWTGTDGYKKMMALPAETAQMGPVFGNVPTIGMWYPRFGDDHESLQQLVLTGKRIMAKMLTPDRIAGFAPLVEQVMRDQMRSWGETIDLVETLYPAVYEAAVRHFAGDEFWRRFGDELVPTLRAIANGIDIPRAALAVTPAKYLMSEYRHTRRLVKILHRAHRELPHSPLFAAIHAAGVRRENCSWMAMYILWNATAYPGSYTLWTLCDLVTDARASAALAATDDRLTYLTFAFWETVRLYPISSLVRHLSTDLEYEHGQRRYWIPAGTIIGVAPGLLNRDPELWDEPNSYRPERFSNTPNPKRALFGAGPFACVAQEFARILITGACDAILTARDIRLLGPLPERRCRVHLLPPNGPMVASATVRAPQAVPTNA